MKVMKFGGSSVGNAQRISDVIDIIFDAQEQDRVEVVVSAFQGVTDQLISMSGSAAKGDQKYRKSFQQLKRRHLEVIAELNTDAKIDSTFAELEEVLHGVFLVRELTDRTLDFVMSFGE